ncbi:MAG: HGxxPAAW family protein [Nocardioidaceae bacterium]
MHGSTPAAWTAVIICLIGFTVGAIGLMVGPTWIMFWIGLGLALVSGLVGMALSAAGLGAKASH